LGPLAAQGAFRFWRPAQAQSDSDAGERQSGKRKPDAGATCGRQAILEERKTGLKSRLQRWAERTMRDVRALWLAARDPRTPWYARWFALAVAAYAVSPIDLIPDFIPVLGYLDDLLLVPLGIWLAVRMIPREVLAEHRAAASAAKPTRGGRTAAIAEVLVWMACMVAAVAFLLS
jgi:uncharacterized membrane protein YkvA (DUF1232 family)